MVGVQQVLCRSVGPHVPAQQLSLRGGVEDEGTSAVTEQDCGVAVVPVDDPAHGLGPDQEDPAGAGRGQGVGGDEPVDESGAGGVEVHGPTRQPQGVVDR